MHPSHPHFGRRVLLGGQRVRADHVTVDMVRRLDPQLAAAVASQGRPAGDAAAERSKGQGDGIAAERERCAAIWELAGRNESKAARDLRLKLIADGASIEDARKTFGRLDAGRGFLRDLAAAEAEVAGVQPLDGYQAQLEGSQPGASILRHVAAVNPSMLR